MKVEINETKSQGEVKYPCIMKGVITGAIVLFIDECEGMALNDTQNYRIGHFSKNWSMIHFAPFNGSITLSNK